jgi:putative ABC transport system substrate-binding protein
MAGESYDALRQGIRELGYHEGKNLYYERRSSEGRYERLPALASELVALKVDVIVVTATVATRAAQQATQWIPIVMVGVGDPIGQGFIVSLARPGGNITGFTNLASELSAKRLELLTTLSGVARVAYLHNPDNPPARTGRQNLLAAAKKLGVSILPFDARNPVEIDQAFTAMVRGRADALIVQNDPIFTGHRQQIVAAAEKARLPATYGHSGFVDSGGLMSYGVNLKEHYRYAATHVHKILKGAKPSDIPVEQPTTFEFVINMKTAKALGIKIPPELMVRAERIIE